VSAVAALVQEGATGAESVEALMARLAMPRVLWLMLPAALVDATISALLPHLYKGDIVIDGGNSYYRDDMRRAGELQENGVHYVDVGTSGGVWGLERGYCLMVGGEREVVARLGPLFTTLVPGIDAATRTPGREEMSGTAEAGYLHCGPSGAGHFVKMVHNGIEYGVMAAYAEGFNILRHADAAREARQADAETTPLRDPDYYRYDFNLADIAELWRRGSVISSWILDLSAGALLGSHDLDGFQGRVADSGEGRWTVMAAIEEGVPCQVLSAALYERFASRGRADYADRLLSAMRHGFGGHKEKAD
jgi:6-phosphogluconate dehydrogenase